MNSETFNLPEPCAVGLHRPVIVHRCGGKDARYWNACGLCGRHIERADETEPWATHDQVEEHIAEQQAEARLESEREEWEAYHPEERCPTRE